MPTNRSIAIPQASLLGIPAELREQIWAFVLRRRYAMIKAGTPLSHRPALTKISRQIAEETLPIFYGNNTFTIPQEVVQRGHERRLGRLWLENLGANARRIRALLVTSWYCDAALVTIFDEEGCLIEAVTFDPSTGRLCGRGSGFKFVLWEEDWVSRREKQLAEVVRPLIARLVLAQDEQRLDVEDWMKVLGALKY